MTHGTTLDKMNELEMEIFANEISELLHKTGLARDQHFAATELLISGVAHIVAERRAHGRN